MAYRPLLALRPAALLLPALATLGGDDPAVWSPPPGATLVQSHVLDLTTELESLELRLAGQEVDPADAFEEFRRADWEPRGTFAFRATDRDLRLAPAPPLAGTVPLGFEREYAPLRAEGPSAAALAALLPEGPVRFEREASGDPFRRTRPDGTTEASFALLAEDLSWRRLEPGLEHAEGARWRLELDPPTAAALVTGLVDASGLADGAAPDAPWALLLDRLHAALAEAGRATLAREARDPAEAFGADAADDDRAAPLALAGGLETALDVAALVPAVATFQDARGRPLETATEAELRLDLDLAGRGLWSLGASVLREGSLTLQGTATLSASVRPVGPDGPLPVELTLDARWSVEFTHGLVVVLD